jgi:hypothetical protein
VIINYVKRGDVRGTWLETHFRWQIRTFWFGALVALCGCSYSYTWLRPVCGLDPGRLRRDLVHLPHRARLDGPQQRTAMYM